MKKFLLAPIIFLILSFVHSPQMRGQDIIDGKARFLRIGIEDGLSNLWISDIHQDGQGYMWFGTQYGLNKWDGSTFTTYTYDPTDETSLSNNWIIDIEEDTLGRLWLGSYGGGLHMYDPEMDRFTRMFYNSEDPGELTIKNSHIIYLDKQGDLWIGWNYNRLFKFNVYSGEITYLDEFDGRTTMDLVENEAGIVIGFDDGFAYFDKTSERFEQLPLKSSFLLNMELDRDKLLFSDLDGLWEVGLNNGRIRSAPILLLEGTVINDILVFDNKYFLAGNKKLIIYDGLTRSSIRYVGDPADPSSINEGQLKSLYLDLEENLWIGGVRGLNVLYNSHDKFEYHGYHPLINASTNIRGITSTKDHIWLASGNGVMRYSKYDHQLPPTAVLDVPIRHLFRSMDDFIYAGPQYSEGFFRINPVTLDIVHWSADPNNPEAIYSSQVYYVQEDRYGGLIIAAREHLEYLNKESARFIHLGEMIENSIGYSGYYLSICLDKNDQLWIGTSQYGVIKGFWDPSVREFPLTISKVYQYDPGNPNSLSNNTILLVYEDKRGDIWVCSDGGLNKYDPQTDSFTRFTRKSGLENDKLLSAEEDSLGRIWWGSISHGLMQWNAQKDVFLNFKEEDGLIHNAFLQHSSHTTEEGIMLFANEGGVQVFDPHNINLSLFDLADIQFTELKLANEVVKPSASGILTKATEYTTELSLSHRQNNLSLSFAIPHFSAENKYSYSYKLEGASEQWVDIPSIKDISFANLTPRDYNFTLRACLQDQCKFSKPIAILIRPPIWATWWAYLAYGTILVSVFLTIYHLRLRSRLDHQARKNEEAIHEAKTRFFTNITHEFRTPLMLISGPIDRLLYQPTDDKEKTTKVLEGVKSNAKHLLNLVNNVLEVSRFESGLMPTNYLRTDIVAYMHAIVDTFVPHAQSKGLKINYHPENDPLHIPVDREKLRIISSNLLSNAIKYSTKNSMISVRLKTENGHYVVRITDRGHGMTPQQITRAFDRFYRAEDQDASGTGLGLSLTKDLVHSMNGNIRLISQLGRGTTAIVRLPILGESDIVLTSTPPSLSIEDGKTSNFSSDVKLILLVEDNDQVAQFIMDGINADFKVIRTAEGKSGFLKAIEIVPDLIISDVMMPVMDGFELCRRIKTHPVTDHIPVILLTARSDDQSRIEGMNQGADAYLIKPFNDQQLKLVVTNILKTRERLLQKLRKQFQIGAIPDKAEVHPFVSSLSETILSHLEDQPISIEFLCKKAGMSKTQLHRKLKILTDKSTMQFVTDIKLSKARILLADSSLNISEIAYQCGFSDPAYFAAVFSKAFECSASQYRKKVHSIR